MQRVAYSRAARKMSPTRPCSGHFALIADCKFPWRPMRQLKASLKVCSSDPPTRQGFPDAELYHRSSRSSCLLCNRQVEKNGRAERADAGRRVHDGKRLEIGPPLISRCVAIVSATL